MTVAYLLVENLPKFITKKEISDYFQNILQAPQKIYQFIFKGKSFFYDLQSAVAQFKVDSVENTLKPLKTASLVLNGHKLNISIKDDLVDFLNSIIVYDISQTQFNNIILPIANKYGLSTYFQIITESQNLTGYILRFQSVDQAEKASSEMQDYRVQFVIQQSDYNYVLPKRTFELLPKMNSLFDFHLVYFGKRYGVFRCIASKLSEAIENCTANEIILPNYEGPISLIIDFLNLQEIVISPETENFLSNMANFLGIPKIIKRLSSGSQQQMCIANAPSLIHTIIPGSNQYDDFCIFLAENIVDLVQLNKLSDLPLHYAQKIVQMAAKNSQSHDAILQLIINLELEGQAKRELIKFVDPKKVSPKMLASFFDSSNVDLNRIRDFVEKAVFDD